MTTKLGWCWVGTVPELLVIEPERFKTPKVVNKEYNKRGVIDCPSYQGFYNNLFVLKSPISFRAIPDTGSVSIESDEVDTQHLQSMVQLHQPQEMFDIERPMFQLKLNYLFLADEPCLMEILPPFMHNEKFLAGLSLKHLNKPNTSFNKEVPFEKPIQVSVQGAYEFDLNPYERRFLPNTGYIKRCIGK